MPHLFLTGNKGIQSNWVTHLGKNFFRGQELAVVIACLTTHYPLEPMPSMHTHTHTHTEQSFTKIQTRGPLGPHIALTRGTWAHPKTTTNATCITYLKQRDTEYQDWQNYFHNIAKSPRTHLSCTSENCPLKSKKIWLPLDGKDGQFVSSKCWHDTLKLISMAPPPPNPEQRADEHTEQRVNDLGNQITTPDILKG